MSGLASIARRAGRGDYAFEDAAGGCRGYVQVIQWSDRQIEIHRLWAVECGSGAGSSILRAVCDLADRHEVDVTLKPLPFGQKPYPLSREQLHAWYARHGFAGTRKKMVRKPVSRNVATAPTSSGAITAAK